MGPQLINGEVIRRGYARACILVDIIRLLLLGGGHYCKRPEDMAAKYWNLQILCFLCGGISHLEKLCTPNVGEDVVRCEGKRMHG